MSKLKYILVCILILLSIFSLSGCTITANSKKMNLSDNEIVVNNSQTDENLFLSTDKIKNLKKITSSGMLDMYLDEKTFAVCIYDTISGKMWRSLPSGTTREKAANLIAQVIVKGNVYTLNSQSDSLAPGCAEYQIKNNGLILSYTFRRALDSGKKIDITVPLVFTLTEGNLSVNINLKDITDNSTTDVYISRLSPLLYFGADSQGNKGDYILLPSASGVILDTHSEITDNFSEISLPVYGQDVAHGSDVTDYVPLGVFGMKSGDSAFVCLIDKGDAIATVKASKAVKDICYNRVGAEFETTASIIDNDAFYLSKNSYKGEIALSYRFLSGNNADYITMAGACRELLIRRGTLTDNYTTNDAPYPFNLTLISNQKETGTATSEEETKEMLSTLTAKGIGNIRVMLKDDGNLDISELSDFAAQNSISLSLSQNLFSHSGKAALTLRGTENSLGIGTAKIKKNADNIIRSMRKNSVGVCLTDCGSILPSDYGRLNFADRSKMLTDISSLCTVLSSHGKLTISAANIYTVKYADSIINIPLSSPLEDNIYCSGIPFFQAVLHGICDYSFTPINLCDDPTAAILKAMEYGAVPHYEWYFSSYEDNDNLHYMNTLSQARLVYENAKNILGDLRHQRITAHEEVRENVTCTIYSGGSEIYVNYNNETITVNGITIDPMSFIRVN